MTKADTLVAEAQGGYSGKIPTAAVIAFKHELTGLIYGKASLVIHVQDGKLLRFVTGRDRSCLAGGGDEE
jgi:hypothetical protein